MNLKPLEVTTAALVVGCLQRARTRCISPALALHQAGLLMTDDLANHVRHDTLLNAAEVIRKTRIRDLHAAGLIPREPTPAVVVKAIADRLDWLAGMAEQGDFR